MLLLFVCEMLTRLLRKCSFLIGIYQFFRLFIKIPFQTMPDLSWHTCKPPLHCMCLASKAQHERDHLLLLCTVVPFPDGSLWASEVQRSYTIQPYAPCIHGHQMLDCSAARSKWCDSWLPWCWTTATRVCGINQFEQSSVRRVRLGAGFILLLKQVLRLFCLAQWIAVHRLHRDTSLEQCFWPWCSHPSPPAIPC